MLICFSIQQWQREKDKGQRTKGNQREKGQRKRSSEGAGFSFSLCPLPFCLLPHRLYAAQDRLVVRLVPGVLQDLPIPDHAVLVDDEDRALRNPFEPDHVLVEHAVGPDRLFVEVAQEGKRQLLLIAERLQRKESIN